MVGIKTNERPGTRARASYVRCSAYKARAVLDQIRGQSCANAQEILAFSERDVAQPIHKVLQSALSNAEHNDGLDIDDLYVSACYADEGPTLKRWRPRARGRATRIRKRTCHITVIVSLYDPETLERLRAVQSQRSTSSAEARQRRVAQSRAAAQAQQAQQSDEDSAQTGEQPAVESVADDSVAEPAVESVADDSVAEPAVESVAETVESEEFDTADADESASEEPSAEPGEESKKADGSV